MHSWTFPLLALTVGLVAAVTDYRTGRVPNWLTFTAMLMGMAGHCLHSGFLGCAESLLGALACGVVPGILYAVSAGRGIGGGDVKLFAGLGALLGPSQGLEVELSSFLVVGIFALFRLAFLGTLTLTLLNSFRLLAGVFIPRQRKRASNAQGSMLELRMGPAILVAVLGVISLPFLTRWVPWLG